MMHPARSSSLHVRPGARPPLSPGIFPGGGRRSSVPDSDAPAAQFLKVGLEELAARRAELYALSRNILEESGKKRGWSDGWASVPLIGEAGVEGMDDIDLDADDSNAPVTANQSRQTTRHTVAGFDNQLLRTALDSKVDFYRLYETLTDKALRHFTVAGHIQSVKANIADLAMLKFHLGEFGASASYFCQATPFFGESGWGLLELSMLVMYSRCLEKLHDKDQYVRVVLKLLSKAARAERDRIEQSRSSMRMGAKRTEFPESSALVGFLDGLLKASDTLPAEVRVPLANFFYDVEVEGSPKYGDRADSFSLTIRLRSLLVDDLPLDSARVRIVSTAGGGQAREIWLETKGPSTLKPGKCRIQLHSNVSSLVL